MSDWFYRDVVYHHADARPDSYQHIDCRVKQTPISAWMRVPVQTIARSEQVLTEPPLTGPSLALRNTDRDRVVIHEAMYAAVRTALKRVKYYHEDRGDGVLVLVPPEVPKGRLVSNLLARLEAALGIHNASMERQNASRAAATQVRLPVAVHAGEVTFDGHGVVGPPSTTPSVWPMHRRSSRPWPLRPACARSSPRGGSSTRSSITIRTPARSSGASKPRSSPHESRPASGFPERSRSMSNCPKISSLK